MRYTFSILTPLLFCFFLNGCNDTPLITDEIDGSIFYSTTFDNETLIQEWDIHPQYTTEAPQGGGGGSAYISGGCVIPHTSKILHAQAAGQITISTWAKLVQFGGGISVRNLRTNEEIHLEVTDTNWQHIQADEWLSVKNGDELQVSMNSGGLVAGGMLVTQLDIYYHR